MSALVHATRMHGCNGRGRALKCARVGETLHFYYLPTPRILLAPSWSFAAVFEAGTKGNGERARTGSRPSRGSRRPLNQAAGGRWGCLVNVLPPPRLVQSLPFLPPSLISSHPLPTLTLLLLPNLFPPTHRPCLPSLPSS